MRGRAVHEFTALSVWMWRFCQRHTIRQLSLQGEKLSTDKLLIKSSWSSKPLSGMVATVTTKFLIAMRLACTTSFSHRNSWLTTEKSADGCKMQKEWITIKACSNATDKMKLPLLYIRRKKIHAASRTSVLITFPWCTLTRRILGST